VGGVLSFFHGALIASTDQCFADHVDILADRLEFIDDLIYLICRRSLPGPLVVVLRPVNLQLCHQYILDC